MPGPARGCRVSRQAVIAASRSKSCAWLPPAYGLRASTAQNCYGSSSSAGLYASSIATGCQDRIRGRVLCNTLPVRFVTLLCHFIKKVLATVDGAGKIAAMNPPPAA